MTFSIVALDSKTKALGVAASTAILAVGSAVPHVETNVGAIATQAETNIRYGVEGLRLLKEGFSPEAALNKMLLADQRSESRQVIIVDAQGRTAAFTGRETVEWAGHLIKENYVVAGNMLIGSHVLEAMTEAFQAQKANLAERLLAALEAGQEAGGDKRGRMSAALKVVDRLWTSESRQALDLRVDAHPDPVTELRRIFEVSREYFHVPK